MIQPRDAQVIDDARHGSASLPSFKAEPISANSKPAPAVSMRRVVTPERLASAVPGQAGRPIAVWLKPWRATSSGG